MATTKGPFKIKWREEDKRKLQKAVKNFNAKITRVSKAHPDWAAAQPARRSAKEMEQRLKQMTRADFNRAIRSLQRYSSGKQSAQVRTTPGGAVTTKWQLDQNRYDLQRINRNREEKKQQLLGGAQYGSGKVHKVAEENLYPIKDITGSANQKAFDKFSRMLELKIYNEAEMAGLERYHDNLLRAIDEQLGKNNDVYRRVAAMDSRDVFTLSMQSDTFNFDYVYDKNKDYQERITNLILELDRLGVD